MKGLDLFVALAASVLCAGVESRNSPHAEEVLEYYTKGSQANRYSDNLLEDARLDVPGLVTKYGYPVEVHQVTTEDGYILELHRVPHGRDQNNTPGPRPAVLVQHGLLSSSADWVLMGPGNALAYILAEAGFDVWLGNARGNYYSRNHVTLNPNSDSAFWKFSWEEIGMGDLTAMIDHILTTTGRSRLHYIGHSQGTTAFWVMASMRPEYNDKIISMHAFAPVAYLTKNANPFFQAIAPYANQIEILGENVGIIELFPNHPLFSLAGRTVCSDASPLQPLCTNALFLIVGRSEDMLNATMFPVKLAHTPAGAAVRQIVHYGQHINKGHFRRFDHGFMKNWNLYRSFTPPIYPVDKIVAPVFFHYVDDDVFAHVDDVDRLWMELGRPVAKIRVPLATFSHLDFMWGIGAKSLLYDRTIDLMKIMGDI